MDGLERQFYRAYVDATRDSAKAKFTITTTNISRLILDDSSAARQITVDGDSFDNNAITRHFMAVQQRSRQTLLIRTAGHWQLGFPGFGSVTALRKMHNLQGPINDCLLYTSRCV